MAGRPFDYVALTTIFYKGSRAYNVGDPVPAANVQRHGYQVGVEVAEYGTPDADRVTGRTSPVPERDSAAAGTRVDEPTPGAGAEKPAAKPAPKTTAKKTTT